MFSTSIAEDNKSGVSPHTQCGRSSHRLPQSLFYFVIAGCDGELLGRLAVDVQNTCFGVHIIM
jgi:hypothetical protein